MEQLAHNLWLLAGWPRYHFNVYLMGDVLVDAATRWGRGRILRQLGGRPLGAVALSHAHPDHQGAAAAVCTRFKVPLWCHESDSAAVEGRAPMVPDTGILRLGCRLWAGPPHPVARLLREGDEVGGFRVVHTPGHTPGHVSFFRDSDGALLAGDVLANIHFLSGEPGLREPPRFFSQDVAENRRSILKLAALRPRLVCFGHGGPLTDMRRLERVAERLADPVPAA